MTFDEYQGFVRETAQMRDPWYPALGLAGETGEVIEIIKKSLRDKTPVNRENLKLELGDVLWYVTALCNDWGFVLEDVFDANVDKLNKRHGRR